MSELKRLCRETYQRTIKDAPFPKELKLALRSHERVPVFIDNLAKEIGKISFKVKRETIEQTVRDMTLYFVEVVKFQAEDRVMSPIRAAMLKMEIEKKKALEKLSEALESQGADCVTTNEKGHETSRQEITL